MIPKYNIALVVFVICISIHAQNNKIFISAELDTLNHELKTEQKIVFYNTSNDVLKHIYLHDWSNSFKNNKTPLGKRFIENYKKEFYFADDNERGYTNIHTLKIDNQRMPFNRLVKQQDVIEIALKSELQPRDSIVISSTYITKLPSARFTGYGKTRDGYHLRYWYLVPAVYDSDWNIMSHLNMDDLYEDIASYEINLSLPKNYVLESNLYQYKTNNKQSSDYYLVGQQKKNIILNINKNKRFKSFQTKHTQVKTDVFNSEIDHNTARQIIQKEVLFIESYLGKHPNLELLIDANSMRKNSLQEIYGLPDWLKPYPENFRWEMRFLNALTTTYIDDVLLLNKRKDYWLMDGIQTFLMIEYTKKHYPNVRVLGKYAKLWGLRNYNISKLKQNDKYPFLYQFTARKFYDQPLTLRSDSLSNFNRKVVSKFKAGLGLKYLQDYLNDSILERSIKEFYSNFKLKRTTSNSFQFILEKNTNKDLSWFFGDYLNTDKKIDYKIKKVKYTQNKDSIVVTIKNKRQMSAPVALYGVQDKNIKFKRWISGIDTVKTVTIKANGFQKLALNYEQIYPEYNSLDNFRTIDNTLLNKPLQLRFLKDVENPYYNQIFYRPDVKYNIYDGIILGVNFNNKAVIEHNFKISITPNYATKSKSFTGGFSVSYDHFLKQSKLYKITYGISGSNYHYTQDLGYNVFYPYVSFQFRRNSLRDVGTKTLLTRLIYVNKEILPGTAQTSEDRYNVFNLRYIYNKPNVIQRFQYALNAELGNNFTKLSTDMRYREFFNAYQSFDLRFFGGFFLSNNTDSDYFSFGLNRGADYLFEQNLFGRSEQSGLFSQQFVIADGGFKSLYAKPSFANQYVMAMNTSVSLWKWFEVYNDVAVLKSKHQNPRYFYENGVRLNLIPNIFEFYFPIYTNEGWQTSGPAYPSKIRFVITTNIDRIYNFIRRGIL